MQKPLARAYHLPLRALPGSCNLLEPLSVACSRVLFHTRNAPGIPAFQSIEPHLIRLCHISMTPAASFMGLTSSSKLSPYFVESLLVLILPSCPLPLRVGFMVFLQKANERLPLHCFLQVGSPFKDLSAAIASFYTGSSLRLPLPPTLAVSEIHSS